MRARLSLRDGSFNVRTRLLPRIHASLSGAIQSVIRNACLSLLNKSTLTPPVVAR